MKTIILAASLSLVLAGVAVAQPAPPEVAGDWQGVVSVGDQSLPIVIHLGAAVTGDSPSENRFDIAGTLENAGGKYKVSFVSGGVFEGALTDGKLVGAYSKGDVSVPLTLERKAPTPPTR